MTLATSDAVLDESVEQLKQRAREYVRDNPDVELRTLLRALSHLSNIRRASSALTEMLTSGEVELTPTRQVRIP